MLARHSHHIDIPGLIYLVVEVDKRSASGLTLNSWISYCPHISTRGRNEKNVEYRCSFSNFILLCCLFVFCHFSVQYSKMFAFFRVCHVRPLFCKDIKGAAPSLNSLVNSERGIIGVSIGTLSQLICSSTPHVSVHGMPGGACVNQIYRYHCIINLLLRILPGKDWGADNSRENLV